MDFIDRINNIANKIPKFMETVQTEEATKNAFIMPFITALGYDVFDPSEIIPEYTADVGTKKGEKVDYVIKKDNKIVILIECKKSNEMLDESHATQLFRYFTVTDARFAILTNGIKYRFYSDIEEPNKMDNNHFFEFNLLNYDENGVEQLKKFTKTIFNLDNILTTASSLKYTGAIKRYFGQELNNPSEEFVRFLSQKIYPKRVTQQVLEKFTTIVKNALSQFIRERVHDRLKSALEAEKEEARESINEAIETVETENDGIITTDEEIEGFNVVKAIVREIVDINRVILADRKRYCNVLLDNNVRKPIIRMHFNTSQFYLSLFKEKDEEKVMLKDNNLNEIFKHSKTIKATVKYYLKLEKEKANNNN